MHLPLESNHDDLAELVAYKRRLIVRAPLNPDLHNVVAVGSVYNGYQSKGICPRDIVWLKSTLDACRELRLSWASDFRLYQPDLGTNHEDYLSPDYQVPTDILVTCFIGDEKLTSQKPPPEIETLLESEGLRPLFAQSPYKGADAWRHAAKRNGARLIVSFHDFHEVNGDHFEGEDYILWEKDTPIRTNLLTSVDREEEVKTYYRDIVVRRDLYDEIKSRIRAAPFDGP